MGYTFKHLQNILLDHIDQMSQDLDYISDGKRKFMFFVYDAPLLRFINEKVMMIFAKEKILLDLSNKEKVVVVGDIHGHIIDLYKILKKFDLPPSSTYLFLGDLVDRGGFSLETVVLIYILKILYPENIYIIRGNHEFINKYDNGQKTSSFKEEIMNTYNDERLYLSFIDSFSYIPLAAKIGSIICLHGGIGPDLKSINDIQKIKRPIDDYDSNKIIEDIIWSDPFDNSNINGNVDVVVKTEKDYLNNARGRGCMYTINPFLKFMQNSNMTLMIRAHECVDAFRFHFDKKLITLFSASSYTGESDNRAGALLISKSDNSVLTFALPKSNFIPRTTAIFIKKSTQKPVTVDSTPNFQKRFPLTKEKSIKVQSSQIQKNLPFELLPCIDSRPNTESNSDINMGGIKLNKQTYRFPKFIFNPPHRRVNSLSTGSSNLISERKSIPQ